MNDETETIISNKLGMTSETDSLELAVRRILAKEELETRRLLEGEVSKYQAFLQSHFRMLTAAAGMLVILASGIFFFMFGKSADDLETKFDSRLGEIEKRADALVDKTMIEYRINESYRQDVRRAIDAYAKSAEVANQIAEMINPVAKDAASRQVVAEMDELIRRRLAEEIASLSDEEARMELQLLFRRLEEFQPQLDRQAQHLARVGPRLDEISEIEVELGKLDKSIDSLALKVDKLDENRITVDLAHLLNEMICVASGTVFNGYVEGAPRSTFLVPCLAVDERSGGFKVEDAVFEIRDGKLKAVAHGSSGGL